MTKEEIKIREIFNRYRKSLHIQKLNEEGYLHLFEDDEIEDLTALKKHQLINE